VIVLLTNDDGIDSLGLRALQERLAQRHEVWVVAPESNRSGSSHSITLGTPTRFRRVGEREYVSGGTPADCVLVACLGLLEIKPEIVISGVNLGPNLGTDIVYSGTAAAARQGAFMGLPSIACSLDAYEPPFFLDFPVEFITRNLEIFVSLLSDTHFLNLNFPNRKGVSSTLVTHPARRIYKDELVTFTAPRGDLYCFIGGSRPESVHEEGSDYWALEQGSVSLSPIVIHPANHEVEERYRGTGYWTSGGVG
jgi:5'-nucleotidase